MSVVEFHPYTTYVRHMSDDTLYPVGTQCLAARLPSGVPVITFETESIILHERFFLKGVDNNWNYMDQLHGEEDAKFLEEIEIIATIYGVIDS